MHARGVIILMGVLDVTATAIATPFYIFTDA